MSSFLAVAEIVTVQKPLIHRHFCGAQIFGTAHQLSDAAERYRARALLATRYPTLQRLSDRSMIEQAYSSAEAYRLVPNRIIMIDNGRGFAHKETLDLQPVRKC